MYKKGRGFTLVELLAVIVILAIILVIAVPSISSTITESRKGALASSVKLIASSAESMKISNQALGIENTMACEDVSNYTKEDYKSCYIEFVDGKASVTIIGKGKFEGMSICGGTKEDATIKMENKCYVETVSFEDDSWGTIVKAVKSGSTENYNVGDTKEVDLGELGTHTLRISNMSECDGTLESETACGFVLEFADVITTHVMNNNNTNAGGWSASEMYSYVNQTIYNLIPEVLRSVIIKTTVVSSHGSEDTNNFESEDYLYLLSPVEVWGASSSGDTALNTSRQLDYYSNKGVTLSNCTNVIKQRENIPLHWWIRNSYSYNKSTFYFVGENCSWSVANTSNIYGVSPAFKLA